MSRSRITKLCLLILISAAMLSGCRRGSTLDAAPGYEVELIARPSPAAVGEAQLELELTDPDGQAVEGAQLSVRGDMTHAGMTPVLAEATELGDGRYQADWEWTMAGDWVVTVEVELLDGTIFERTIDLSVTGGDMMDHDS
jgi:hypothetical protein